MRKRKKQKKSLQKLHLHCPKHWWGGIKQDEFHPPNGQHIAELSDDVLDKCPDFLHFGMMNEVIDLQNNHDSVHFLGGLNNDYGELFLPDRPGFLYYNEALEDLPVIFDTGATISVSPDIKDFISYDEVKVPGLTNITGTSPVQCRGDVKWILYDDKGFPHEIVTKAYFVPTAKVHLFSVQYYLSNAQGSFLQEGNKAHFMFQDDSKLSFSTYDVEHNRCQLPLAYLTKAVDSRANSNANAAYNVLASDNTNLSVAQKELFGWHFKLSHFNVRWIQNLT